MLVECQSIALNPDGSITVTFINPDKVNAGAVWLVGQLNVVFKDPATNAYVVGRVYTVTAA